MKSSDLPQLIQGQEAEALRSAYLQAFIDTGNEHYRQYVEKLRDFSDGKHYTGYLWDCLRSHELITVGKLSEKLNRMTTVLVMSDNHSHDRVIGAPLWPYAPNSIARFKPHVLFRALPVLPEDLYFFESDMQWTLILTHEHEDQQRLCFSAGKEWA